ncbi:APC family permease [Arthrobacter bambusae]|uniref:Amino acid transporter n=1 Tax=Arthrobacter bambusae TaxID=1338426 RepID=A0AAW8DFG4_9MICC|nr:APC family permease [Arthrobacter bambusae]MDP9907177.1 amino acid transporter [Arthrobacter bambusae]MDQ0131336.1 amino acid transporter [Arthrobacter bambusae]MDQ0182669.1 amino acid transporter [Arthrobacter bambusae]
MTQITRPSARKTVEAHDPAGTEHGISGKGLKTGQLGLLAVVVLGISSVAPAYSLTSSLGPAVNAVGLQLPAIFIVAFIPMILVAFAYRELNADSPDSGTTFTWATKAFGPFIGWMGGWGLLAANIIVLSNLAGVAVDFFYLFLAQVFGNPDLADLTSNKVLNIATCLAFVALAVWVSYRGLHATKLVQYAMVGFQVVVLGVFIVMALTHASSGDTPTAIAFSWDWFDPTKISSFEQFAAGMSLAVFVYWGWDVCLTVNEETKGGKGTAGKAGTTTAIAVLGLYVAVIVATMMVAGVGGDGIGLNNPDNQSNIFAALASPVMGPLAILMSLAVLAGTASSLQSTMASPARSLLAMGHYGALPQKFSSVSKRFGSPGFATIMAGAISGGFYAIMKVVSENVLNDTILALGLMICFYYGMTAFACAWYFRHSVFSSVRNFFMRLLFPVIGGVVLTLVFIQTAVDSWSPDFGSGSEIFGVGLVFIIGVGILALGAVVMVIMARVRPGFFRGETLRKDTPALVVPE